MTIAIGILCPTFLVMAADSQESFYGIDVKRDTSKISMGFIYQRGPGQRESRAVIAVSGSGGTDYLNNLKYAVKKRFTETFAASPTAPPTSSNLLDFELILESAMVEFFDKHYLPFAVEPNNESLCPDLIVAAGLDGKYAMWQTFRSTVTRVPLGAACAGAGRIWAEAALSGMTSYPVSERAATLAAAYAVFSAKEHSESCGKTTRIFSLRNNANWYAAANQDDIERAESVFRRYDLLQSEMLNAIVTPQDLPNFQIPDGNQQIVQMRDELNKIQFFYQ